MNSNVINVSLALLSIYVISSYYKQYQKTEATDELENNNLMINEYLLQDIKSNKLKKPILWIHIPYKKNARKWDSFYSRSNENINQDYIYLCVKSIIDKCGQSFHVCVIDDNSFQKMLPNWNIDMTIIDEPILDYMRTLGLMKLMYNYGGMLVPYSFVCYRDLIDVYNNNNKAFFGEFSANDLFLEGLDPNKPIQRTTQFDVPFDEEKQYKIIIRPQKDQSTTDTASICLTNC